MKKMTTSLVLGSVLAASTLISGVAVAEISANVGMTSNYIWRGTSQSADRAAVSGGLDYSHESGFYAGTWTSSVDFDPTGTTTQYELDLYAGYAGEASGISYDVGLIQYMYPIDGATTTELDFMEVQVSADFGPATLYIAKQISAEDSAADNDGLYISLSAGTDLNKDFGISGTVGKYSGDDIKAVFGDEYTHFAIAVSKGDFTFAIEKNSLDGADDPRAVVSWSAAL